MNLAVTDFANFKTTHLEALQGLAFEKRLEGKYLFPAGKLETILQPLTQEYTLLTVNGRANRLYENIYYDTAGLDFYLAHHNGKTHRFKVRERYYTDTGNRFLEIKQKLGEGKSSKKRHQIDPNQNDNSARLNDFILTVTGLHRNDLHPSLSASYERLTLCTAKERITFDLNLVVKRNEKSISFEQLVIAELKQESRSSSLFFKIMQDQNIREQPFSKYCLGLASLVEGIKANNFKALLGQIRTIQV